RELATGIIQRSRYAMKKLLKIQGIKTPIFQSSHYQEFTVNFEETEKSAEKVNRSLLERGIQGGRTLRNDFPDLGDTSLFCVTEVHSKSDIDNLAQCVEEVVSS
ncbi:MAG TPA: hypothetical protein VLV31_07335, partial [Candidatus Acidoferrales bacterium]|nr:hypothetical protein [Candidatus Acidoferrales bacterium]